MRVAQAVWDSLPEQAAVLPTAPERAAELNRRLDAHDRMQMIEGVFDPDSLRLENRRLVLRCFDARIVNGGVTFDVQNPVRYIAGRASAGVPAVFL